MPQLCSMRSALLVLAQFACIGALALGGHWLLPWWSWLLFGTGSLILLWAAVSLGGANLTVMPDPRAANALSTRGIYRYVRHPMYTAVLLCGAALAIGAPTAVRLVTLPLLLVVLLLKIRHEEALLAARHPAYHERMRGVKRLLPGIW